VDIQTEGSTPLMRTDNGRYLSRIKKLYPFGPLIRGAPTWESVFFRTNDQVLIKYT